MRERVYLVGGTFEIESSENGTRLRARLPLTRAVENGIVSVADQMAS
jgi:signal transduction histidine kinase